MSVVLLSDGRGFNFFSFTLQVFLLYFPSFLTAFRHLHSIASCFPFDWFGLRLWALSPSPSATLLRLFSYFAQSLQLLCPVSLVTLLRHLGHSPPFLQKLCPFPSGRLGRFFGRGEDEEKKESGGPARKSLRMRLSGARKVQADLAPKIIGLAVE